jgi:hypothetical protein
MSAHSVAHNAMTNTPTYVATGTSVVSEYSPEENLQMTASAPCQSCCQCNGCVPNTGLVAADPICLQKKNQMQKEKWQPVSGLKANLLEEDVRAGSGAVRPDEELMECWNNSEKV